MGFDDGLIGCNTNFKRTENILTVAELKRRWLFGINIKDDDGNDLSDETYQDYINAAVAYLETYLDIKITPGETATGEEEFHDYERANYVNWSYLHLNNIPVRSITSIDFVFQKDENGVWNTLMSIPSQWYRLKKHSGIMRMVPNANFPGNLSIGSAGIFYPNVFSIYSRIPLAWRVSYKYGFEDGEVPILVNNAIGLIAAIHALNIAGDLVVGAGIASKSLSIDALSDSINTTSSAENHAYSAKLKEYQRLLFGKDTQFSKERGIMGMLKDYFNPQSIEFL